MAFFFPMQEQFTKFTFNHAHLYILEEKIALFYLTSSLDVNCVFTHLILFPCFLLFSCNKCEFPVFFFFFSPCLTRYLIRVLSVLTSPSSS